MDGIAGRGVGRFLVAAPDSVHGVERRVFRGADEFKLDGPLGVVEFRHLFIGEQANH